MNLLLLGILQLIVSYAIVYCAAYLLTQQHSKELAIATAIAGMASFSLGLLIYLFFLLSPSIIENFKGYPLHIYMIIAVPLLLVRYFIESNIIAHMLFFKSFNKKKLFLYVFLANAIIIAIGIILKNFIDQIKLR